MGKPHSQIFIIEQQLDRVGQCDRILTRYGKRCVGAPLVYVTDRSANGWYPRDSCLKQRNGACLVTRTYDRDVRGLDNGPQTIMDQVSVKLDTLAQTNVLCH
jgi:hypothetical protein